MKMMIEMTCVLVVALDPRICAGSKKRSLTVGGHTEIRFMCMLDKIRSTNDKKLERVHLGHFDRKEDRVARYLFYTSKPHVPRATNPHPARLSCNNRINPVFLKPSSLHLAGLLE